MRIDVDKLQHRYRRGSETVVQEFTHVFAPGTITGVTGASGSGKSTLMYLLALMLTPSSGTIRWDDQDVHSLPDAQRSRLRAQHVGFVFQDAVLDPSRSAISNVLEAAGLAGIVESEARRRAAQLMDRFGVSARSTHRPGEVSGGQAQRIALCRALVKEPTIIFADEPTGNLDAESAAIVWDALGQAAMGGATVVVATHDVRQAQRMTVHVRLGS